MIFRRRQRFPGGRAPFAIPSPFAGVQAFRRCPRWKAQAQARIRRRLPVPAAAQRVWRQAPQVLFFAPGLRAPAAIPRPLTSGSGLAADRVGGVVSAPGASSDQRSGLRDRGFGLVRRSCAGAFLAPGRLAPAAMPSP